MFVLEDIIADSFEEQDGGDKEGSAAGMVACEKVAGLVRLSSGIASNPAFARQARRKFVK